MSRKFEVVLAFENYRVGQILEPTGLWRGELLRRGLIREVQEQQSEIEPEPKLRRKKNVKDVIADSV